MFLKNVVVVEGKKKLRFNKVLVKENTIRICTFLQNFD